MITLEQFFEAFPTIPRLIGQALPRLQRQFPDLRLRLEMEREGEHVQIWVKILTTLEVGDALERLQAFDREWWLEMSPQAECRLGFGLEYVSE